MATVGFEHIALETTRCPPAKASSGTSSRPARPSSRLTSAATALHQRTPWDTVEIAPRSQQRRGHRRSIWCDCSAPIPADAELLEAFAVAAAISIEKANLHRQIVQKHRLDQQIETAREVQASLLPARAPIVPGYDIAGLNLPAWDVGGDYFDYFPLPDERLGLVIADVSGKGVPAAILMATFRAALRTEVRQSRPIPAIIDDVHQTLVESMDNTRFVTAAWHPIPRRHIHALELRHNPPIFSAGGDWEFRPRGGRLACSTPSHRAVHRDVAGRYAAALYGRRIDVDDANSTPGEEA
jgi:hypothetical protein